MKMLCCLIFLLTSASLMAQAEKSQEVLSGSSLKFIKDINVGPKKTSFIDLFFVEGNVYGAKEFIEKSQSGHFYRKHYLCILTINRKVLGEDKSLPLKDVSFELEEKQNLGLKSLKAMDNSPGGASMGVGNGYDGEGVPVFKKDYDYLLRYPIKGESSPLKSLYCFTKFANLMLKKDRPAWSSSDQSLTLIKAFGDYLEMNLVLKPNEF